MTTSPKSTSLLPSMSQAEFQFGARI
jgi:hypothetical protein